LTQELRVFRFTAQDIKRMIEDRTGLRCPEDAIVRVNDGEGPGLKVLKGGLVRSPQETIIEVEIET
jgi:hypothetical protein